MKFTPWDVTNEYLSASDNAQMEELRKIPTTGTQSRQTLTVSINGSKRAFILNPKNNEYYSVSVKPVALTKVLELFAELGDSTVLIY